MTSSSFVRFSTLEKLRWLASAGRVFGAFGSDRGFMASTLQMNLVRALPLVAAISVVVVSSLSHSEEQQPQDTRLHAISARRVYSLNPAITGTILSRRRHRT